MFRFCFVTYANMDVYIMQGTRLHKSDYVPGSYGPIFKLCQPTIREFHFTPDVPGSLAADWRTLMRSGHPSARAEIF